MALKLRKLGVNRVFPLQGGVSAWLAAGLPTERFHEPTRGVFERADL